MPASTLTSKGQITIPQEIREELQLRKGQRLEFRVDARGCLILKPLTNDIRRLRGIVRSSRKRPPSLAAIRKVIADGYARQ
jgi:antitoxin PrlF